MGRQPATSSGTPKTMDDPQVASIFSGAGGISPLQPEPDTEPEMSGGGGYPPPPVDINGQRLTLGQGSWAKVVKPVRSVAVIFWKPTLDPGKGAAAPQTPRSPETQKSTTS